MRKGALAILLVASLIAISCSMGPGGGGGANSSRVVTGTIVVPFQSYWANLKLGVFSGGDLGTYPRLGTADNSLGVGYYRVIYNDVDNGTNMAIPPIAGASYSISDTSGTSSAYSFELPATIPKYQKSGSLAEYSYYAAWIDSTANGNLDLKDASSGDVAHTIQGELNRCATKATTDTFTHLPTTITIDRFEQSRDLNGNPTGNYKYSGYDSNAYNEQLELATDTNSGFNFTINPSSGW